MADYLYKAIHRTSLREDLFYPREVTLWLFHFCSGGAFRHRYIRIWSVLWLVQSRSRLSNPANNSAVCRENPLLVVLCTSSYSIEEHTARGLRHAVAHLVHFPIETHHHESLSMLRFFLFTLTNFKYWRNLTVWKQRMSGNPFRAPLADRVPHSISRSKPSQRHSLLPHLQQNANDEADGI